MLSFHETSSERVKDLQPRNDSPRRPSAGRVFGGRRSAEAFFLSHLEEIGEIISRTCRRFRLRPQDAEDFASEMKLRLIEGDYAVLRKFRQESCWRTFLTAVVRNKCSDFLDRRNGKWRPSRAARRLGRVAVALETLQSRDGLTLHEAVEVVRRRFPDQGERRLRELAANLPERTRRSFVGEEHLRELAAVSRVEENLEEREANAAARRCDEALQSVLEQLDTDQAHMLRLRCYDGLTLADIARRMGIRQRSVYSRWNRCRKSLCRRFQRLGISAEDVRLILERGAEGVEVDWAELCVGSSPVVSETQPSASEKGGQSAARG